MDNINNDIQGNEYSTKELYFAAFLQIKGMRVIKLEKYNRPTRGMNPVYFIFENRKRCEELENAFWNGTGEDVMGNIKQFTTAVRDLRSRAFSVSTTVDEAQNSMEVDLSK